MAKLSRADEMKNRTTQNICFVSDGRLTVFGQLCVGLGGVLLALASIAYTTNKWLFIIGFIVGALMIGFVGVTAKARVLGIRPFTRDPLGWRKAKSTYVNDQKDGEL